MKDWVCQTQCLANADNHGGCLAIYSLKLYRAAAIARHEIDARYSINTVNQYQQAEWRETSKPALRLLRLAHREFCARICFTQTAISDFLPAPSTMVVLSLSIITFLARPSI
jgi:hypothetical protein